MHISSQFTLDKKLFESSIQSIKTEPMLFNCDVSHALESINSLNYQTSNACNLRSICQRLLLAGNNLLNSD